MVKRRKWLAGVLLLLEAWGTDSFAQTAVLLEPGPAIRTEISGGETRVFHLRAAAGQFLRVVAEQQGLDVELVLLDPKGAAAGRSDTPAGSWGPESISIVTDAEGEYEIRVKPLTSSRSRGEFSIRAEIRSPLTAELRKRVEAEKLFHEAQQLRKKRTAASVREALAKVLESAALFDGVDDYWTGLARNSAGLTLAVMGEFRQALPHFDHALAEARRAASPRLEVIVLLNSGGAWDVLGEWRRAKDCYEQGLAIARKLNDPANVSIALNNIGKLHYDRGDYRTALRFYHEALVLFRAGNNARQESIAFNNIGSAYNALGEPETAREYFLLSLERRRTAGDAAGQANALNNLGMTYVLMDRPKDALPHFEKALEMFRQRGDRRGEAFSLGYLGEAQSKLANYERALWLLEEASALVRQTKDKRWEGVVRYNMARTHELAGNVREALLAAARAIESQGEFGDRKIVAQSHLVRAKAERRRGDAQAARQEVEKSLSIIERMRAGAGGDQARASYLASTQSTFEFYIDVLMELHRGSPESGYAIAALEASERARARGLLDLVSESGVHPRVGVDASLIEEERRLEHLIQSQSARLLPMLGRGESDPEVAALSGEMRRLRVELEQVRSTIREKNPHYANLTQPAPLRLPRIQQLLEPGTAMLEYALGDARSYVWIVTRDGVDVKELPGRGAIDGLVRRMYELVTARTISPRLEGLEERRGRIAKADWGLREASAEAGRILIPAEAMDAKRLVIVADGSLHQLSFALLTGRAGAPLIATHELASVPSASVLEAMRRELRTRAAAPAKLAVFADPVYGLSDTRLRAGAAREKRPAASRVLEHTEGPGQAAAAAEPLQLARLPYTEREARRILQLAGNGGNLAAMGFQATRERVLSSDLGQYRYIHFATHGIADADRPGMSAILLSLRNKQGEALDGLLRADDVYNLQLSADMVVLSACQTGLGKQLRGEGILGLTRGFLHAGAARVVVSMWSVNDEATSELMRRFYRRVLAEGKPAAAALREAQLELRKDKRWQSPYYWAAFVQQGEWR